MKPKTYSADKVAEVAKALAEAPALAPSYLPHEATMEELKKHIRDLYFKKNYAVRQIAAMLEENGIKTTQKELRIVLQLSTANGSKAVEKKAE